MCRPQPLGLLVLLCSFPLGAVAQTEGFSRAVKSREFRFPRDHANHPDFKTEWWYFTGSVKTPDGALVGYQATWFRSALVARAPARRSPLAARDLFFFHGATTNTQTSEFVFDEAASRGAPTWAEAPTDKPRVVVLGQRAELGADGAWRLRFTIRGRRFDLRLVPERAPLLHGELPGLSRKGPESGQASYYASLTRLRTEGTIQLAAGEPPVAVRGHTWFDHEFGSNQLAVDQDGWDWFSVALDDGTDLMLYELRGKDGRAAPSSSGTVRTGDGQRVHLAREDFRVEVLDSWTSPLSGGEYPSRWRVRVPKSDIELEVRPVVADQELRTRRSTGVTYWEGLCEFSGSVNGRAVKGYGYVELVGYAGAFRAGI